jgi:hypothetical protein
MGEMHDQDYYAATVDKLANQPKVADPELPKTFEGGAVRSEALLRVSQSLQFAQSFPNAFLIRGAQALEIPYGGRVPLNLQGRAASRHPR